MSGARRRLRRRIMWHLLWHNPRLLVRYYGKRLAPYAELAAWSLVIGLAGSCLLFLWFVGKGYA